MRRAVFLLRFSASLFLFLFLLNGSASARAQERVDQIEFEGVTVLSQEELESALEFDIGDPFLKSKVIQTEKNISVLYEIQGFHESRIRYRLEKRRTKNGSIRVIVFRVEEGDPTRISRFRLAPEGLRGAAGQNLWSQLEIDLVDLIDIQAGDIFDRDRIAAISKRIENALLSDEFIGAKLIEIRSITQPTPDLDLFKSFKNTSKWVDIEFHIDLGERISFGFRGNEAISRSDLFDLVKEQRTVGLSSDFIDLIRERILETYRAKGFAEVAVRVFTFEKHEQQKRHVTYVISEGERHELSQVSFDGNFVFSEKELRDQFYKRGSLLIQNGYFVKEDVESAAELVIDWMKSQGYLSAKLVTFNMDRIPSKFPRHIEKMPKNKVLIYVYEGEQTIVQKINIEGLKNLKSEEALSLLKLAEGKPLDLFSFNEGIEKLKARYRALGYLDIRILNEDEDTVVTYGKKNRVADVLLKVQEGAQYRVSKIQIEGLTKTKPFVVRRELRFKEGDILGETKVGESEKRLRRLGILSSAKIQHRDDPEKPGYKQVRVLVGEGTPGFVSGGVGIRNDLGIRLFGNLGYSNLWHRNHTWLLSGNVNRRFEDFCRKGAVEDACFAEFQLRMGYVWPWFILDEMTFRPEIIREKRKYDRFDADSVSVRLNLERSLLESIGLTGVLTYSLERTRQFNSGNAIDDQTLTIGSITPTIRFDLRDDPLAPTSGFFSSTSFEIASTAFGSQSNPFPVGYTRFQFRADQFFPLSESGIVWYVSFRTGVERNTVDPADVEENQRQFVGIPLVKQFALGGASSLRGFQLQQLNFQDLIIQGNLSFVNYRTQVDFPLAGSITWGPFLDAANILVDDYSLGRLRYGAGFGLRYRTPIGPVNFDWGFNLEPKPGEDPNVFHFSVGIL